MKHILPLLISLLLYVGLMHQYVYAHGGIPRVLSIKPQADALWVIDTLGFFRAPWIFDTMSNEIVLNPNTIQQQEWQWLCDDAVDAQSGISEASLIGYHSMQMGESDQQQVLLAMARSGLYRSEDQGCSFQKIEGVLVDHVVTGIFPHPQKNQEILAITQTLGKRNDVYLSEDTGRTWTALGLNIDGVVYQLWRAPQQPQRIWLHHAEGLSYSEDAGRTWNTLPLQAGSLMLRARELSLLGGGYDSDGSIRLFMSVNRYPESLLLTSSNEGRSWQQIHSVNDSYDSLVYQRQHVMVATPFEGLFVYDLTGNTNTSWANWIRYDSLFVDCLVSDEAQRIWGCGRAAPSNWLIAYTDSFGADWKVVMQDYQSMAQQQQSWNCPVEAESMIACEARCLEIGCDPSGLDMVNDAMTTPMNPNNDHSPSNQGSQGTGTVMQERDEFAESEVVSPSQDEGCTQSKWNTRYKVTLLDLWLSIFCLFLFWCIKRNAKLSHESL